MSKRMARAPRSPASFALLANDRQGCRSRSGRSSLTIVTKPEPVCSSSLVLHRDSGWNCSNFPSAGVTSATLANTPSNVIGSTFKGITLIIAFCAADLSDSTASASPVWPSPTCSVATSSQGQRTASCSWGPALMLPAAAVHFGHTYRSGMRPHPTSRFQQLTELVKYRAFVCFQSVGHMGRRGEGLSNLQPLTPGTPYRVPLLFLTIKVSLPWCHVPKGLWSLNKIKNKTPTI